MPRSIDGHGWVSASRPPPTSTVSPVSLRISAAMPGNGRVAEPGLSVVTPGSGVIMIAPVSVCHHVSTIGQRSSPMMLVIPHPRFRIDRLADRSEQPQRRQIVLAPATRVPQLMNARIAVGAV